MGIGQNDSSSENDLVLFVVDQQQHHSEQWVFNLGCSYHMCLHMYCKSKGKKYVVKQETKKGNLYMLQGSTVTSSLLTVSQAKSHASNNNSL